jgi:transposase
MALTALFAGAFTAAQFLAAGIGDRTNVVLNVLTIVIAVGVSVPVVRNRRKDQTIKDLNDALTAKDARVRELRDELSAAHLGKRQIEQAAMHCREEATQWRARYEEIEKYTAEVAVKQFEEALERHAQTVAGRHQVLIEQGKTISASQERITATLERIADKL